MTYPPSLMLGAALRQEPKVEKQGSQGGWGAATAAAGRTSSGWGRKREATKGALGHGGAVEVGSVFNSVNGVLTVSPRGDFQ